MEWGGGEPERYGGRGWEYGGTGRVRTRQIVNGKECERGVRKITSISYC